MCRSMNCSHQRKEVANDDRNRTTSGRECQVLAERGKRDTGNTPDYLDKMGEGRENKVWSKALELAEVLPRTGDSALLESSIIII